VNNAVARVGGLLAVAAVPLVAGINPARDVAASTLVSGFHTTMVAAAGLVSVGAILAFVFIRSDVLATTTPAEPCFHCSVSEPPAAVHAGAG
jgi:hypothetical protein